MALAAETARLVAEMSLDDKKFTAGAKRVSGTLGRLEKGVGRVGSGAGQLSAGLARAGAIVGTAVVGGFGAAAKAAIDWEDAFTGVVKTVDEADLAKAGLSFADLSEGLRAMSRDMPTTAVELAGIAENAGALGIAGKDILAFTKQVAILASTTDVSAEDAAIALGQLQNVIGLTGDEFDNFAASLVDLGNKGASTEGMILEIARRSGGAAKLFGIAKDETLGWAAAAANLGLNEELAGTALQNVFVKLLPKISSGSKELASVMGKSAKEVKRAFDEDAGGALEDLVARLGKMPKDARLAAVQKLFGKGSGITRLLLGLADSYETNLAPALDTATELWKAATAAQIEFDKRNATVRSSLIRLKNNVIDAAVTIGEGMTPAIGRASEKLSKFLSQKENREFLKDIGKDIGQAIDAIDWDSVITGAKTFVDVLKIAFDYAGRILGVVNALPTEIKAAGVGFLALNKLSGGLIGAGVGNIAGGIGETIVRSLGASLPGALGKAFVQPVFVTNFPVGFGAGGGAGGVAGAAGKGIGALGKVFLVGEAIGLALAVNEVREGISDASTAQATELQAQTDRYLAAQPSRDALTNSLAGVQQGIKDLTSNPLLTLVQGEALDKLRAMEASIKASLAAPPTIERQQTGDTSKPVQQSIAGLSDSFDRAVVPATNAANATTTEVERMRAKMATDLAALDTSTLGVASAARNADTNISSATRGVGSSVTTSGYGIQSAIRANRPITNVEVNVSATTVQQTVDVITRYGPPGGDRRYAGKPVPVG